MTRKKSSLLTEVELELMNVLWTLTEGTVRDVLTQAKRKLAYTSVSTILRILEQKQIVGSRKDGNRHIYFPILKKEDYEEKLVNHMLSKVFNGDSSTLVRRLVETQDMSEEDLNLLKAVVDQECNRRSKQ